MKPEATWWKVALDEELERHSQLKREDLDALGGWLDKQPHLPPLPESLLAVFLCACSFSIEQAKEAIEINYTIRSRLLRVFTARTISSPAAHVVRQYIKLGLVPHTAGQPVILAHGLAPMDLANFDPDTCAQIGVMLQDVSHLLLGLVPQGYHILYDLKNYHLGHLLRMPLTLTAEMMKYGQEGSCCKIRGIHVVNGGQVVERLLAFLKPFMSLELRQLINIHSKTEDLVKMLGSKNVPSNLGGDAPSMDQLTDDTFRLLEEYSPWFVFEEEWRVKEDKRTGGDKNTDGLAGSFRKLQVD